MKLPMFKVDMRTKPKAAKSPKPMKAKPTTMPSQRSGCFRDLLTLMLTYT